MTATKDFIHIIGREMAFKFRLGDTVIPTEDNRVSRQPQRPGIVAALELGGFIEIQFDGPPYKLVAEDKYYELWSEEIPIELDD